MKTISFIVPDINFGGGGERVVANMANYFVNNYSYNVEIISLGYQNDKLYYQIDSKVKIKYLYVDQENSNIISNILFKLKSYKRLNSYLNQYHEKHFVLGIGTYPNILLAHINGNNLIKIGCEHSYFNSLNKLWCFLRKISYKKLDATISLTNEGFNNLNNISRKCYVIPNARTFAPVNKDCTKDNKQLLFIGRISYEKGYDYMLEVFEKLSKQIPDWNLLIVGDGPLKDWLTDEIKRRSLQDRITQINTSKNIINEYLESSIYLMTSRNEGLPMVLLEAQAFGLPIICFNCQTGPSEIVTDGFDGFLIDPFEIDVMVKKIKILIEDEKLRILFSKNAIQSSDKFSEGKIYSKWKQLFNEL